MDSERSTSHLQSTAHSADDTPARRLPGWLKVSALAAASALAGGLAAAWIYRKAISRLQNSGEPPEYSNFGSSTVETEEED